MEFSVTKEVLLKGLGRTQSVIEKKTTLPILSNVLIEARKEGIEIIATDLEVGIKGQYEAEVITPGSITVGAKKLFEIVRELPDESIHIKGKENNRLDITCGNAKFNIVGLSSEDFPILPSFEKEDFHVLPANMLNSMIEKVQYAVSTDETRYYLNGVFFKTEEKEGKNYILMVATDGHRLAMIGHPAPEQSRFQLENGCIIPRKGIQELRKALSEMENEVSICFKDKNLIVHCDNILFVIRLIDDDFPEYSQVIPSANDRVLTCSRDQLAGSLRRVSLLSTDISRGVKFSLKKKALELSTSNPDLGEAKEEMIVGYEGEDMSIGFNSRYFLDVLNVIRDEDVVIELADELSPGLVRVPSDPGFIAVVMPMRL